MFFLSLLMVPFLSAFPLGFAGIIEGVKWPQLQSAGWLAIFVLSKLDPDSNCSFFIAFQSLTLQACKGVDPFALSEKDVFTIGLFFSLLLAVSRGDAIRIQYTDHSTRLVREQGPDRNSNGREEKGRRLSSSVLEGERVSLRYSGPASLADFPENFSGRPLALKLLRELHHLYP